MNSDSKGQRPLFFTVPKVGDQINEDSWQWSHRGIVALSDGATISFDSAAWSTILVRNFCRQPSFSASWLRAAIAEFGKRYDRESLPWMKQAAFDRGSFASLVGIQLHDHGKIQIFAVGDTLAVLCDGDEVRATFPYQRASEFDRSPQLISTSHEENAFLRESDSKDNFDSFICDWNFGNLQEPSLLCMTDALGRWLLSNLETKGQPVRRLRQIRTKASFEEFVKSERASGRLKTDDTTLVAYW
jgi:hypothetical protein